MQAAFLLVTAMLPAGAQTWDTIVAMDPDYSAAGYSVMVDPFSSDPSWPDLFIGGSGSYGQVLHIDQSTEPATTTPALTAAGQTQRLAKDSVGNLYSAGYERRGDRSYWQVRKSSNGGASWVVVDDAGAWNKDGSSSVQGLTTDLAGNVYASGTASDRQGKQFWVIRRGANQGQSWATCYKSSKPLATGMGMAFVAPMDAHAGGVFAVGSLTETKTTQWSVLRSKDAGVSWQWVDAWGTSKMKGGAHARAITADGAGNVYVAGYDVMGIPAWYVRLSRDGGSTWQTILADYTDGDYNRADDIASDPWGNVYVAGMTQQAGNGAEWTIRRWDAPTQSWDQWPDALRHPLSSQANVSVARGIVCDALARVYVTGTADSQWLVQRLELP
ncbi:MAG: hypothetical protein KJ072_27150 [Verrucomicrobia bacterium]|nr:hypothetical protein [Verrucomicrobiota bacterium]